MKIQGSQMPALYSPSSIRKGALVQDRSGRNGIQGGSFESKLNRPSITERVTDAIRDLDASQMRADSKIERLASGEDIDIHGTMIALQEADITLRFAVSVRDKLLEGYQRIMQLQI